MIRLFSLTAALFALGLSVAAAQPRPASDLDRAQVRQILIDILREEPQLILEALQALEAREQAQAEARQREALATRTAALERDGDDLVTGNPSGDVTIVEFFDYRCPFCKRAQGPIEQAVKADGRVRVVHKQMPILGPESVQASRAVLAARTQNRAAELHRALMALPGQLTEAELFRQARSVGLDEARLRRDMANPAIDQQLSRSLELARALDIRGTPAFVIGQRLIPGVVEAAALTEAIQAARVR
jgi:protein-disulfide isomerase